MIEPGLLDAPVIQVIYLEMSRGAEGQSVEESLPEAILHELSVSSLCGHRAVTRWPLFRQQMQGRLLEISRACSGHPAGAKITSISSYLVCLCVRHST